MLVVVAQCGLNYGVIDTNDYVVEWVSDMELFSFVANGVEVQGVSEEGIEVNPLFYVSWGTLNYSVTNIRKGYNNRVEFSVGDKNFKMRLLMPISKNTKVTLGKFSFVADVDGYLCKLTNGICTIIPTETFEKLFSAYISY